jgi:hypothetical protein
VTNYLFLSQDIKFSRKTTILFFSNRKNFINPLIFEKIPFFKPLDSIEFLKNMQKINLKKVTVDQPPKAIDWSGWQFSDANSEPSKNT